MRRLLFVDGEPHVLDSLRDALRPRRREWQMTFAGDAQAGLDVLAEGAWDVVVSNMRMPGMDGAALLARVGELHPRRSGSCSRVSRSWTAWRGRPMSRIGFSRSRATSPSSRA